MPDTQFSKLKQCLPNSKPRVIQPWGAEYSVMRKRECSHCLRGTCSATPHFVTAPFYGKLEEELLFPVFFNRRNNPPKTNFLVFIHPGSTPVWCVSEVRPPRWHPASFQSYWSPLQDASTLPPLENEERGQKYVPGRGRAFRAVAPPLKPLPSGPWGFASINCITSSQ